ncbi:dipeptidase [Salinisphaera hydrothermalis]|uniref:Membrane dipeptidase n=1 Tax=Salinisphaera hydrothermalis (strain C41B8) TaxID=1304275 RepID=A0A084IQG5_SALHC|nr:dipeptidase [Salinisphaera hydrothermalis]KEZ78949.1 Membrane dipeptidase [Salinisphaera hydrothermalis C41B8]
MQNSGWPSVFDGHNDMLLRLAEHDSDDAIRRFFEGRGAGHLDWPRMHQGRFGGGLFAVFIPPTDDRSSIVRQPDGYDKSLSPAMDVAEATSRTMTMVSRLYRLEAASEGRFRVCRSVADIRQAQADSAVAAVLHFEGAEAIDTDLEALDVFHAAGLRSLGLVWSRPNAFGRGVPFRFPSGPDIGDGLTEAGFALVRACNRRHIAIDLSHLNEKGFWDVARTSDAPLIASHSNAHAICPHARNLTDDQLRAIARSGGIVGLNFATYFLRPDGGLSAETSVDVMLDHLDHMIAIMGVDHVGLGSDFDGVYAMPIPIRDVASLPALQQAMHDRGYDAATIAAICRDNWLSVLEVTWGE